MATNITQVEFNPELPPAFTLAMVRWQMQREREKQNAAIHAEARQRYGNRLPLAIPFYYTMDDIVDRVHGFNLTPQLMQSAGVAA